MRDVYFGLYVDVSKAVVYVADMVRFSCWDGDIYIFDERGKDTAEKVYLTVGMYGEEYVQVSTDVLKAGDDISVTYQAAKTSTQNNNRRSGMGGPPRMF